jgi:hypothetical protein
MSVQSIHLNKRLALMSDGAVVPIDILLDSDGDHTDAPAEAVIFVTARDSNGKFYTGTIAEYFFDSVN